MRESGFLWTGKTMGGNRHRTGSIAIYLKSLREEKKDDEWAAKSLFMPARLYWLNLLVAHQTNITLRSSNRLSHRWPHKPSRSSQVGSWQTEPWEGSIHEGNASEMKFISPRESTWALAISFKPTYSCSSRIDWDSLQRHLPTIRTYSGRARLVDGGYRIPTAINQNCKKQWRHFNSSSYHQLTTTWPVIMVELDMFNQY